MSVLDVVRRSWRLDRRMTLVVLSLMASQNLAFVLTGLGLREIVDQSAAGRVTGLALAALAGAVGFGLTAVGDQIQLQLRTDLADRIGYRQIDPEVQRLTARLGGLDHLERSSYLDRVNLVRGKGRLLAEGSWAMVETASWTVRILLTLALLGTVHPALLFLVLFAVPAGVMNRSAYRDVGAAALRSADEARLERHLHGLLTSAAGGREIRVDGSAALLRERASAAWRSVARTRGRAQLRSVLLASAGSIVFTLGFLAALVYVVSLVSAGDRTVGDLVMVLALAGQLRTQFDRALYVMTRVLAGLAVAGPYRWLRDYAAAAGEDGTVDPPSVLRSGITLREVSFRYPGAAGSIGPLSAHLPAGAMVAIVGEHGCGKTTLVKLLAKFYRPDAGDILVDDVQLTALRTTAWRARMTAAFQDFQRYEVPADVAVGLGDVSAMHDRAAIENAVRAADADAVVASLPRGLDTPLGGLFGGVDLSEGQWQRLALARACMPAAPLLVVLDEPTASLDARSEHAIFTRHAALARRLGADHGTVTVVVSHRFSTVQMADLILVMAGGRIAECGGHDDLIAAGGIYAELYGIQAKAYSNVSRKTPTDPFGDDS